LRADYGVRSGPISVDRPQYVCAGGIAQLILSLWAHIVRPKGPARSTITPTEEYHNNRSGQGNAIALTSSNGEESAQVANGQERSTIDYYVMVKRAKLRNE
jgi:hypothetical protein